MTLTPRKCGLCGTEYKAEQIDEDAPCPFCDGEPKSFTCSCEQVDSEGKRSPVTGTRVDDAEMHEKAGHTLTWK